LTPDVTPYEAGLAFAVALDKPGGFIGREALVQAKASEPPRHRVVQFTLDDPEPVLWGGEAILRDGLPVGEVSSAAFGPTLGRPVALGTVRNAGGVDNAWLAKGGFEIDLAGDRHAATAHARPAFDPMGARLRPA
jgi:4-methylaminobutanoate oxidase (formaldehyde-forming)